MSEITQLIEKLRSEGKKIEGFFASLTDEQWQTEIYTEEASWSVRNVLAHFVTSERAFLTQLFPDILAGGSGASADFSIDRFNARQQEKSAELAPLELLEQYRSIRAKMIEWVIKLNETDLKKSGRHPFLGWTTLHEMIKTVYIHNLIHYRDIKKNLEK